MFNICMWADGAVEWLNASQCNLFPVLADHDRHRGRRQVPIETDREERERCEREQRRGDADAAGSVKENITQQHKITEVVHR